MQGQSRLVFPKWAGESQLGIGGAISADNTPSLRHASPQGGHQQADGLCWFQDE